MIAFPILRSRPAREVGMPVSRENCCLACVTPRALFQEKDNPGIFIFEKCFLYIRPKRIVQDISHYDNASLPRLLQ